MVMSKAQSVVEACARRTMSSKGTLAGLLLPTLEVDDDEDEEVATATTRGRAPTTSKKGEAETEEEATAAAMISSTDKYTLAGWLAGVCFFWERKLGQIADEGFDSVSRAKIFPNHLLIITTWKAHQ